MSEEQSTPVIEEEVKPEENKIPELWNPNIASWLSLLFTPIFSSWIISRNWKTLGDDNKAKQGLYWMIGLTVYYLAIMIFFPNAAIKSTGICVFWFIGYGLRQYLYVKDSLKNQYKPKLWGKTMLKGCSILATLLVLLCISGLYHQKADEKKMITETAMGIVNNKILKEYNSRTGRQLECVKIDLKDEFADNNYFATVVFSNGNKQDATIQYKKANDMVIIQLK